MNYKSKTNRNSIKKNVRVDSRKQFFSSFNCSLLTLFFSMNGNELVESLLYVFICKTYENLVKTPDDRAGVFSRPILGPWPNV